ncbi:hypothetical protein BGW80DRAFT_132313 [Lactifluus volemus]|nr:hypothetical protein BGW80DRAFT_132313 [Lactifluus volemus]
MMNLKNQPGSSSSFSVNPLSTRTPPLSSRCLVRVLTYKKSFGTLAVARTKIVLLLHKILTSTHISLPHLKHMGNDSRWTRFGIFGVWEGSTFSPMGRALCTLKHHTVPTLLATSGYRTMPSFSKVSLLSFCLLQVCHSQLLRRQRKAQGRRYRWRISRRRSRYLVS